MDRGRLQELVSNQRIQVYTSFFIGLLVCTSAVYLTPLKHLNIIEPKIRDIDPQEFYTEYQKDPSKFIFMDVRGPDFYNAKHALGSTNIPLHTLYTQRKHLPKRGQTIVLICSGGIASGVGYSYLEHYGFLNLRRIEGGIEKWEAEGLPVEGKGLSLHL